MHSIRSFIEMFVGLPGPARVAFGILGATSLIGVGYMLVSLLPPWGWLILMIGLACVVLILVFYKMILKWRDKRKAKPFESELAGNTGAVPQGISEAASRARLDDLRKRFEEGVETFKSHGKDLHSLPWFMIVGEPGSGKTEALRHSNIGFPPGLQDELQGSGGTINMDWWFTNNAVILDTAGRLLFDEVGSNANSEWKEFLKLLQKHRPNCPVNGLLLVIPADSLIRDSADEISQKGGRIARQLDLIQRTLGVRFPVFVLLTKADLINGFREFFDELDDPQLQHQIMGWSNPADLDTPFRPEQVEEHLKTVQARLVRRRQGLLLDPVSREGAMGRRTDEVDALFAFPDSLMAIGSRLRRYLELIFVSGEWTSRPLFLRGMYFVSSMRDGSVLDADLAEALGVPVDELPEGRVWERDRSYFLRDLFIEKIFREKGLVTRTSNTSQLQRRRKLALLGTTCAALLILLGVTYFQSRQFSQSIGEPTRFWSEMAAAFEQDPGSPDYPAILADSTEASGTQFRGEATISAYRRAGVSPEPTIVNGVTELIAHAERVISIPFVFRPVAWVMPGESGNMFSQRRLTAAQAAFEKSVLNPLVFYTSDSLARSTGNGRWTEDMTGAFAQLLRLHAMEVPGFNIEQDLDLRLLLKHTVASNGATTADLDQDFLAIQNAYQNLRAEAGTSNWPAGVLRLSTIGNPDQELRRIADRFIASRAQGSGTSDAEALRFELREYETLEDPILTTYAPSESGVVPNTDVWENNFPRLRAQKERLDELLRGLGDADFVQWFEQSERQARERASHDINRLLAVLPRRSEDGDRADDPTRVALLDIRRKFEEELGKLDETPGQIETRRAELTRLRDRLLARRNDGARGYEARFALYAETDALRARSFQASRFVDLPPALDSVADEIASLNRRVEQISAQPGAGLLGEAAHACQQVLRSIEARQTNSLIDQVLASEGAPRDGRAVQVATRDLAMRQYDEIRPPAVHMTAFDGQRALMNEFHPVAGPAMLRTLVRVEEYAQRRQREGEVQTIRAARHEYANEYLQYWREIIHREGRLDATQDWSEYYSLLGSMRYRDVNDALLSLSELQREAIEPMLFGDERTWAQSFRTEHGRALEHVSRERALLDGSTGRLDVDCRDWLLNWRGLGATSREARRSLLQLDMTAFNNDYLQLRVSGIEYWSRLTLIGLQLLAKESETAFNEAIRTLESLRHFPLRRLSAQADLDRLVVGRDVANQRVLSQDEVAQARRALDTLIPAGGESGGFAAGQVGASANRTGDDLVDSELRRLRGGQITEAQRTEFQAVASVLRQLPPTTEQAFESSIVVLGNKEPSRSDLTRASVRFQNMGLIHRNGSDVRRDQERRIVQRAEIGTVDYPTGDIELVLSYVEQGNQTVTKTVNVRGPWPTLALVHKFGGRPTSGDPKVWEVEVIVPDNGTNYSLWLEITFESTFPNLQDWPR